MHMKRNLLLTLTLLGLLLTATQTRAGRIYYAGNYTTPYLWAWTGTSNVFGQWPGAQMNVLPDENYWGRPVYFIDLDWTICPDSCIFNNNGGEQTVNLAVPGYDYMFTGTSWLRYDTAKTWYVLGDLDGGLLWNYYQLQGSGNTLTCTVSLNAGREYYFKIASLQGASEANFSCGSTLTRTTCQGLDFSTDGANAALATTIAGNYVFTFDTLLKTLSVTYPDALAPEAIYPTSVPAENGDVLLQAYYWAHEGNDSIPWTPFGGIQWTDLNAQAAELGQYFDLVWLAPSAVTADYTGFLPQNYSDQNNIWGTETELRTLISNLHAAGSKVVADIVINHSSPTTGYYQWDDPFNFGQYGSYSPQMTWITQDDEIFISQNNDNYKRYDTNPPQNAGIWEDAGCPDGSFNTEPDEKTFTNGEGGEQAEWSYAEYNCVYSRDWAHRLREVREMSRAYLTWMREYMGYDGWRYDFAKGLHGSHIDDYNHASNACFSVAECFDGDYHKDEGVVIDAHYNTYVFDFPAKYNFMNNAIRNGWYQGLMGNATNTMLYNHKRHTVTFVDNHDTFREDYNLCGTPNAIGDSAKVLMANAFILSMPGVPCVFYPHWATFSNEIKHMIDARHITGVHSESDVVDEAGDGYYRATVTGKNGRIRLLLGPNSGYQYCPEGFTPAYVGNNIGMYYSTSFEPNVEPVYFLDTHDWGQANAYLWRDDNFSNAPWPGQTMNVEGIFNGHTLYSFTPNEEYYSNIIFCHAGETDTVQTGNLTLTKDKCYAPADSLDDSGWTEWTDLTHTLDLTASKWTTFRLPLTVSLPDSVWAYYATTQAGDSLLMMEVPERTIPADATVLILGARGVHQLPVIAPFGSGEPASWDNLNPLFLGAIDSGDVTSMPGFAMYVFSDSIVAASGLLVMTPTLQVTAGKTYYIIMGSDNTPDQIRLVFEDHKIPTAVIDAQADDKILKRIVNGHLVIIREGVMYNSQGTRLN